MLTNILSNIIGTEYETQINSWRERKSGEISKVAMSIIFAVNPEAPLEILPEGSPWEDCRYPKIEMLIYGKTNYIGVFIREKILHPKQESPWFLVSKHDSCWRSDGVNKVLHAFREHLINISEPFGKNWYKRIEVDDDLEAELKIVEIAAREDNVRYPFLVTKEN